MKALKVIRDILIVIVGALLMMALLFGAWLQTSYRYCPPSQEEIAHMSWFEHMCYGK